MTVVEFGDRYTWHKAARSASQGGNCVCVATDGVRAGICDSEEGLTGSALWLTPADWAAFRVRVAR